MKNFYLLTGSVFSFIYLVGGVLLLTGVLTFDMQPNTRLAIGSALAAYGTFRVYIFYRKIRAARENEN